MARTLAVFSRSNLSALTTRRFWWVCWYVELLWEPRDIWIGVFWRRPNLHERDLELFVCLLPCLPIRISLWDDSDVPF